MSARETGGTSRRFIARQHLYGATVWAFGGGGVAVRPWNHSQYFSKFGGEAGAE